MIGWGDVYKVVVAMAPLYVALVLGYLSVKWWQMFKPDQCDAINRFNCYFIIPFFNFHFTAGINPYTMNFRFLAGDVVAKAITSLVLTLCFKLSRKGNFSWVITSASLSCFNNTLVVGVPLLEPLYGPLGKDLVVQSSIIQVLIWFPILLFFLEFRRATNFTSDEIDHGRSPHASQCGSVEVVVAQGELDTTMQNTTNGLNQNINDNKKIPPSPTTSSYSLGSTMKKVSAKLAKNPNCYACVLGIVWALIATRWDLKMPSIVEGSILIMAKAGSGVAMFSMGLFMALQEKVIACGMRLTLYGMFLRFVFGPFTTIVGSLVLGLRSNVLLIVIMQAALPASISSFVYAKEYDLHANVLSTVVIFGTIVSLPLLIGYHVALGAVL